MANGTEISPYHVIEAPDWASVVALTPDLKLVMVREYRHARGRVIEGIPGGIIERSDEIDGARSAEAGARRELREETGYGGGRFVPLVTVFPDPGNQTNAASSFLAVNVEPQAEQALDIGEAVEVFLDDLPSVLTRLMKGDLVIHATHVAALWSAAARILAGGAEIPETAPLRQRLLSLFGA
jgi:8-oxo-dGTP pyrophosphatase MutT (NUDIX family)